MDLRKGEKGNKQRPPPKKILASQRTKILTRGNFFGKEQMTSLFPHKKHITRSLPGSRILWGLIFLI